MNTDQSELEVQEITDQQLFQCGFEKITAFVRSEPSKAALRKQRQRERQEKNATKQLNLVAPIETHAVLKTIAHATVTSPDKVTLKVRVIRLLLWIIKKLSQ